MLYESLRADTQHARETDAFGKGVANDNSTSRLFVEVKHTIG